MSNHPNYPTRDAPYVTPATLEAAKNSDPTPQRRTPRGHVHAEAFCLMWYVCRTCSARERIWNSRDGVTPFGMPCASCGGHDMLHAFFGSDEYAPEHKLREGQKFWRDGTSDEAVAFMRRRLDTLRDKYPIGGEREAELLDMIRRGDSQTDFRKGWPMLDVYRGPAMRAAPEDEVASWKAVAHDHSERLKVVTAERDRALVMLRQVASECAECAGRGYTFSDDGITGFGPDDREPTREACAECADVRAAIGEAS